MCGAGRATSRNSSRRRALLPNSGGVRDARAQVRASRSGRAMNDIRRCRDDERHAVLAIVNAAAEAYRGVIPDDCWHEPYMPARELDDEIAAGVAFWGAERDGALL